MPSIVKILRAAADPTRLRILLLLKAEELSVAELQEILVMGQSTISTHLSQLKQAGLVEDRRTGKSSFYRLAAQPADADAAFKGHDLNPPEPSAALKGPDLNPSEPSAALKGPDLNPPEPSAALKGPDLNPPEPSAALKGHDFSPPEPCAALKGHDFSRAENGPLPTRPLGPEARSFLNDLLLRAATEIPEAPADRATMQTVVKRRQDKMRSFFDSMAGRLGKDYVPGKSWKSLAEALLRLMPPLTIADLGAGDGSFALLLSQRAARVIAVDSSAKMLEVGRETAARHGIDNVDFRLGDMEEIPVDDSSVDLVFFSQSLHHALHPGRAVAEAARILRPHGRIAILDLARHRFEEARELYADERLGFSEAELTDLLHGAGFRNVTTSIVDREADPPQFQTLLAIGEKSNP